jgi:hypothetical protein
MLLAEARTCYDHLAGRAGVTLLDALLARGLLNGTPVGDNPTWDGVRASQPNSAAR